MVSSWLHILGAWNLPTSSNYNNISLLAFFMLQPVAITFEDFIIYLGKRAGAKKSCKSPFLHLHTADAYIVRSAHRENGVSWKDLDICLVCIQSEVHMCVHI